MKTEKINKRRQMRKRKMKALSKLLDEREKEIERLNIWINESVQEEKIKNQMCVIQRVEAQLKEKDTAIHSLTLRYHELEEQTGITAAKLLKAQEEIRELVEAIGTQLEMCGLEACGPCREGRKILAKHTERSL